MGKAAQLKKEKKNMKKNNQDDLPTVSLCTPTFNRRPFIPYMIKCFEHQTYPKEKMEWIIIDDGTDKIEDMVSHIPQVKYFKYDEKMTLGKKRNLMHEKTTGEIIVYMDDDDYYPPERVSHAVETLRKNNRALCAGSSRMYVYFKHINKMHEFGPYGPNHSTAATFAFKRELLKTSSYNEEQSLAEEKHFLKDYTVPFVQLNPLKTILVFSHVHNSFDKKILLQNKNDPNIRETSVTVDDFVKEPDIKQYFMEDIDSILSMYNPGDPSNKPDVLEQIQLITEKRKKMEEEMRKSYEMQQIEKMQKENPQFLITQLRQQVEQQNNIINNISSENNTLKEKNKYLEEKMKQLISENIDRMKKLKETYELKQNKLEETVQKNENVTTPESIVINI